MTERILQIDSDVKGRIGVFELHIYLKDRLGDFFSDDLLLKLSKLQFDIINSRSENKVDGFIRLAEFVAALEEDS